MIQTLWTIYSLTFKPTYMEIISSIINFVDFSSVNYSYIMNLWIEQLRWNMSERQWVRMMSTKVASIRPILYTDMRIAGVR